MNERRSIPTGQTSLAGSHYHGRLSEARAWGGSKGSFGTRGRQSRPGRHQLSPNAILAGLSERTCGGRKDSFGTRPCQSLSYRQRIWGDATRTGRLNGISVSKQPSINLFFFFFSFFYLFPFTYFFYFFSSCVSSPGVLVRLVPILISSLFIPIILLSFMHITKDGIALVPMSKSRWWRATTIGFHSFRIFNFRASKYR